MLKNIISTELSRTESYEQITIQINKIYSNLLCIKSIPCSENEIEAKD